MTGLAGYPGVHQLVGREQELLALKGLLGESQDQNRLVLIEGDTGVGKSRLIQELCLRAGAEGVVTGYGHCYGAADVAPYLPFLEILRHPQLRDADLDERLFDRVAEDSRSRSRI